MKRTSQTASVLFILIVAGFLLWLFVWSGGVTPNSLAYPYPGGENTSTPSPTVTPPATVVYFEKPPTRPWIPTAVPPGSTSTPVPTAWPTPTSNLGILTPLPTITGSATGILVARQGVAAAWNGATPLALANRKQFGNWAHQWSPSVPVNWDGVEYVPMVASGIYKELLVLDALEGLADPSRTPHEYWLVYNECENAGQCDAAPEEAADFYYEEIVRALIESGGDPNAQLIVGGVNAHPCGLAWLEQFVISYEARYGPLPHAGWHFHIYADTQPQPSQWPTSCSESWEAFTDPILTPDPTSTAEAPYWPYWYSHAQGLLRFVQWYGEPDDEVWITETGCLSDDIVLTPETTPTPLCTSPGLMYLYTGRITEWLNNEGRWVNRYVWYTDWDDRWWEQTKLFGITRTPTPAPTASPTPTPTPLGWGPSNGEEETANLSRLGEFYTKVTPNAPIPLPTPPPPKRYYMPVVFQR